MMGYQITLRNAVVILYTVVPGNDWLPICQIYFANRFEKGRTIPVHV